MPTARRAAIRRSWGRSRWRVRSWLEEKKREWGIGNGEWKIGRAENARAAGAGRQRMGSRSLIGRSAPSFPIRSEEHTSELQSLMRISYAVFCLKKKKTN